MSAPDNAADWNAVLAATGKAERHDATAEKWLDKAAEYYGRPQQAAVGIGHGLLAVRAELAALGSDLGDIATVITEGAAETARDREAAREQALMDAEVAAVRTELARTDTKTGVLAGLGGAALAVLTATAGSVELWPARGLLAVAGVCLAASVVLAGRVLRPRLGHHTGFYRWASMTHREVAGNVSDQAGCRLEHAAIELALLANIAMTKFRLLRWAVDLLIVGLVLVGAAGLLGGVQ